MKKLAVFILVFTLLCSSIGITTFADSLSDQYDAVQFFKVGGYITFGTYPQTSEGNDKTPIEWLVLDAQDGKALLISRYALDAQKYHSTWNDVTWDSCTLRTWLNSDFISRAFTISEQAAILTTEVDNRISQGRCFTPSGANTQDRVFLLSYFEAGEYFEADSSRKCVPTDYAISQGTYSDSTYTAYTVNGRATCAWWLRSPASSPKSAGSVFLDGDRGSGNRVNALDLGVRPAMWIDLTADIFFTP